MSKKKKNCCFFFILQIVQMLELVSPLNGFGVILALVNPYGCKLFRHVSSYQDQVGFFFHFLTRFLTCMHSADLCLVA